MCLADYLSFGCSSCTFVESIMLFENIDFPNESFLVGLKEDVMAHLVKGALLSLRHIVPKASLLIKLYV